MKLLDNTAYIALRVLKHEFSCLSSHKTEELPPTRFLSSLKILKEFLKFEKLDGPNANQIEIALEIYDTLEPFWSGKELHNMATDVLDHMLQSTINAINLRKETK